MVVFGIRIANYRQPMTPKPIQVTPKGSNLRPMRKLTKGVTETARLFIDVSEIVRKTQTMPLTRYVE